MPSVLHNAPPHLRNDTVPVTQRSLVHIIRLLTWDVALAPPSRARLSYTLDPTPFARQRFGNLFRILDPLGKRHNLAPLCIRGLDNAYRGKLQRFCIGIPREGYEGRGGAVRVKNFDQRV